MKTVLNPDTNEVLGFDDNMSDDQIHAAIQSDKNGRPMVDINPTPYEVYVRPALEQAKLTGNNEVLYLARKRAMEADPFNRSLLHGLTFGLTPDLNPEEKKAYGVANTLGNFAGQTAAVLATAGLGSLVGTGRLVVGAGTLAESALPQAARQAVVGSGQVLAKTGGEIVKNTASGVTSASVLGGMYSGIINSVEQGKAMFGDEDGQVTQKAPDVVKLGESILHGAITWAPYGIGGGFVSKTAAGLSSGTAAITGTAFAVSKAEGHSDTDATFNAILMGTLHAVMHAPKLETSQRQSIVTDLQNNIADYTKAKNGLTELNNHHQMVGDEFVKSEAKRVIEEQQAEFEAAATEAKARIPEVEKAAEEIKVAAEEKLAGTFKDPYDPKMMDYLSQFIPSRYIVRMENSERLRLANSPRKELVAYQKSHQEVEGQITAENAKANNRLENEILLRRTTDFNPIEEVVQSDYLTKKLVSEVTKKMVDAHQITSPEASAKGAEPSQAAPAVTGSPVEQKLVTAPGAETTNQGGEKIVLPETFKPEETPLKGTGEVKESGLSQSVEISAIQKGLTNDLGDLPSYQTRDMAEIAKKVEAFIAKDAELAKKIAMGEAPEQDGLRSQELFTGLKIKAEAEADINTIRELALSDKAAAIATELGQRVKALDAGGEESPVEAIKELKKTREEALTKKTKAKNVDVEKKNIIKEIKQEINKAKPTKETWDSFIDSLQC